MKKSKFLTRILACTLVLSVILSQMILSSSAAIVSAAEVDVWDGTKAESFAGGDGTASKPFLIETPEQLYKMVVDYSTYDVSYGKYFKITNDIYLNDVADGTHVKDLADKKEWFEGYFYELVDNLPKTAAFNGTLDACGHTVYGLYTDTNNTVVGLFQAIGTYATIKNLSIENVLLNGDDSRGGALAGHAVYYYWDTAAQIINCSVTNAEIGANSNMEFAAGFIGDTRDCSVTYTNCYVKDLNLVDWSVAEGGITGGAWNGGTVKMINCYSADYFPVRSNVSKVICTNVYTDTAYSEGNTTEGVTVLTTEQMKGEAAKTYMAGLDFIITWKTVENGYPVLNKDIEFWDGTTATAYAGGSGTASDPYIIENAAQLMKMVKESTAKTSDASTVKNTCFKIVNDIYLNPVTAEDMLAPTVDSWNAKGYRIWDAGYRWSQSTGFCGTIDGDGHTIYGLYVESGCYSGFLANVVGNATVTNLHFKNAFVRSASNGSSPAVIIGAVNGNSTVRSTANVSYCTVDNGYVFSDHTGSWRNGIVVGGGFNEGKITVSNCAVTNSKGVITNTSTEKRTAAFIGNTNYTKTHLVENCFTDSSMHPVTDSTTSANYDVIHDNKNYKNIYTSAAKPSFEADGDITYLTEEQMKGENAKTYMPGLDFGAWETVEGELPTIKENPNFAWNGTKDSNLSGSGTESDPYLINTPEQLAYVVSTDIDGIHHYKLTKDMILNDTSKANWKDYAKNWVWGDIRFEGNFDGDGHTIDGLYFNGSQKRFGLFSYVGDSIFKNFNMTNAYIYDEVTTDAEGVAIVAAQASAAASFDRIYIDANSYVNAPSTKGVAGIMGRSNQNVNITNCAVLATLEGKSHVGAFYGTHWGGTQTLNNSFTASNVPVMTSRALQNSANNYATVADSYGTTVLTADQMKGDAAKENMPALDFYCLWQTVENDYPILREEIVDSWDGSIATALEGEGTKENPYKVSNGAELYYMVSTFSNVNYAQVAENIPYFEITADINLGNKQWYYTGKTSYPNSTNYSTGFSGIIYGNNHTIYNLSNSKVSATVGLIPVATQGTEIYDLKLVGGNLPKADWNNYAAGGLIGLAVGAGYSTPIIIDGCSVEDYTVTTRDASAALVGYVYSQSVTIKDCFAKGNNLSHTGTDAGVNSGAFIGSSAGNDEGNKIIIATSYSVDEAALIGFKDNMSEITTFKDVYTANETYDNSVAGLTKLTTAQMTGETAKANMSGFNFNQIWKVGAEGEYPTYKSSEEKAMYWDGTAAVEFAGGEGTVEKPYEVSTASELFLLANLNTSETKGKYYKLTNDIVVSDTYEGWESDSPFAWTKKTAYLEGFGYSNSFAGVLDGAGYTVSGLYFEDEITDNGKYAYGLIPLVTANAIIKNINVEGVYASVDGNAYVGAVAGAAHVTAEDAANPLNFVQFIGVNAANCEINAQNSADILGGASRGVKFELCNAEKLVGSYNEKVSIRNCNTDKFTYSDDIVVYTADNIDNEALVNVTKFFLNVVDDYIVDINGDGAFDIRDLVSIKEILVSTEAEETLVWSQEFNDSALDYSVWRQNTTMSRGTTLEYIDTTSFNGESMTLSCNDTGNVDANGDKIYSVNYGLDTIDSMSFRYGRLEMRAKVPFAAGAFPSLWLTSRNAIGYESNCEYSTEIDIFEIFAKAGSSSKLITCIHKWYNDENGVKTGEECSCGTGILDGNTYKVEESDRSYIVEGSAQNEFHTFVFEWDENTMKFSVDGNVYYTVDRSVVEKLHFDLTGKNTDIAGIFEQFLCIRLNNHMFTTGEGAAYTYSGDASEIDASEINYEIDYIRLYQKNDGKSAINFK